MIGCRIKLAALAALLLLLAACSEESAAGPGFGLYQLTGDGEKHLLATFTGFVDNNEACIIAAGSLERRDLTCRQMPGSRQTSKNKAAQEAIRGGE